MQIDEFTNTLPRITAGGSGEDAINKLNAPISATEASLNVLAGRIANLNNKSALIMKYAPLTDSCAVGSLVYYDATLQAFAPALAILDALPGENGASIEAPCARVEGMVVSIDNTGSSGVTGTVMCGGVYSSRDAVSYCLGVDAQAGVYYLSPSNAGKATRDPGGHLRQGVLSYYGNSTFSLSLFYMAHDNHFHASCTLGDAWVPVSPSDTNAPDNAVWKYDFDSDAAATNLGEVNDNVTAVFLNGVLQRNALGSPLVIKDGVLWCCSSTVPVSKSVTIFNHFPFAYGSAVVRSVESAGGDLTVLSRNGRVILSSGEFVAGEINQAPTAVSGIGGRVVSYTPVVTEIKPGSGISVQRNGLGAVTVSVNTYSDKPVDAYSLNHNGTDMTSDGRILYITYPRGRTASLVMSTPITVDTDTTETDVYAWMCGAGDSAQFSVKYYWVPLSEDGSATEINSNAVATGTIGIPSNDNRVVSATASTAARVRGNGMVYAEVQINNAPAADVRLLRMGFVRRHVINEVASTYTPEVADCVYGRMTAGVDMNPYTPVMVSGRLLMPCYSSSATNINKCIGITTTRCTSGTTVEYVMAGTISGTNLGFDSGSPLFIGANGITTSTSAETGELFAQRIGTMLPDNKVQVAIQPAS